MLLVAAVGLAPGRECRGARGVVESGLYDDVVQLGGAEEADGLAGRIEDEADDGRTYARCPG
ncbi:hypothetical protein [Streptomyces daliensis]|uniref:Uncharacterized protein n=1 Tax=Streptomyces daliensis TaxID=299421 RepID=A0A8T4IN00_9ACTN|nr:hypothetical protein [Streptomyces daliensis]